MEIQRRQFVTPEGRVLATAMVPSDYELNGKYDQVWQSEMVPHFYRISATAPSHGIYMNSYSKEIYHDVRNSFMKGMLKMATYHTKNGYEKYIEPLAYLQKEAEREAGSPLKAVSYAPSPSYLANNPQAAANELNNDIHNYAVYFGMQPLVSRTMVQSFLYRYEGKMNGRDLVVLAAMDFEGAELDFTPGGLDNIGKKLFGKKNDKEDNTLFGHAKHVDDVLYGTARSYYCMFYAEYESEALPNFFRFMSSIVPDPSLAQIVTTLLNNKMESLRQETAYNQMILQQKQMQLQQNQQRLAQTLAQNSAAMSDMLMDSWNQKMASDSRISQARSEATMGVNTYTNTYGQNVQVNVSADHVYQNQYGDVYGVSGNAPDQETLNNLNWKELK